MGAPVGHPKPYAAPPLSPLSGAPTTHCDRRNSLRRNAETENDQRRNADNIRTNRQLEGGWPMVGSPHQRAREIRACTHKFAFCKRDSINVRFAPKATEVLRCRELTRCANCGPMHRSKHKGK